ncbi:MAG: ATP-dependent DNA helicase RecQ [Saprospiraceae bacterium]
MTAISTEPQTLLDHLQKYFGFDAFKAEQDAIIQSLLDGEDTFVIMPTGGGKSLCYQLPALMLPGTAIVISPLIALMKNQVDSIRSYSDEDEVAHFLNSSLTKAQMKKVKQDITDGRTKILYVAPETLTKEENIEFFQSSDISFVAVDEAHCISEWGHDFRPEYRRIRVMLDAIARNVPIMALTATATPKVQQDILKNLDMTAENTFMSSFNRDNLFYEIRPKIKKEQTVRQIIQLIKEEFRNESGIIYVQNRKTAEDLAQVLLVNDIKAAPYHAGLDPKLRSKTQDQFLMEDIDVICATIAFGMGIDKPDVRFVIHYDMPKSIENYYQETGRAGRDGLAGKCVAFYNYADILRLEKFLRDKPVAEREMGAQLMQEVVAYAETAACRRRFLLHYFGEEYEEADCHKMCDNCKNPKEKIEVQKEVVAVIQSILDLNENYLMKTVMDYIMGRETKEMKDFRFVDLDNYGVGDDRDENFWSSIFRHAMINNLIYKEIEQFGLLKVSDAGKEYLKNPQPLQITINHDYEEGESSELDEERGGTAVLDEPLMNILKDLRKSIAKKQNLPPYIIFQDPSLEDMASQYPITMEDMAKIVGVSQGKAQKYGQPFVDAIVKYCEENEIERPMDITIKTVANKSKTKVAIIQSIDRKIPLDDIARSTDLTMTELMEEMDMIVNSGTKIKLDYYLNKHVDEYVRDAVIEYFKEAETDDIDTAFRELREDEITWEEIQLMRIKFLSDFAN